MSLINSMLYKSGQAPTTAWRVPMALPSQMTAGDRQRMHRGTTNTSPVVKAPSGDPLSGIAGNTGPAPNPGPVYDPVAAQIAAANATARAASKRENENTQKILDTLLGSLKGYEKGRDTQIANAGDTYSNVLRGLSSQYDQSLSDLLDTSRINEADETAKTFSNRQNRAREQQSALEQAASQGAGETDQVRSLVQAFENADANQLEITQGYYDTLNSVRGNLNQTNSNIENARRNAWGQREDSLNQTWNEYYKNYTQVFTDAQRTAASNSNIDSDSSEAFKANFQGHDPLKEATRYVGVARKMATPQEEEFNTWTGRRDIIGRDTIPTQGAPMTRMGAMRSAEGADLRKWTNE